MARCADSPPGGVGARVVVGSGAPDPSAPVNVSQLADVGNFTVAVDWSGVVQPLAAALQSAAMCFVDDGPNVTLCNVRALSCRRRACATV